MTGAIITVTAICHPIAAVIITADSEKLDGLAAIISECSATD